MRTAKVYPCEDCGAQVQRRRKRDRAHLCITCAIHRSVTNTVQIREKSGPAYEKWREGIRRSLS